jgi:hypothetical protein
MSDTQVNTTEVANGSNAGEAGVKGSNTGDALFGEGSTTNVSGDQSNSTGASGGEGNSGSESQAQSSVKIPENWKDSLPLEIKDAPFMKNVTSVETLAKNYANAQKLIGAEKMPVPNKNWGEKEWKEAYQKMGLPEDVKDYNILEKDFKSEVLEGEFLENFKKAAWEKGILPHQAKELVKWFDQYEQQATKTYVEKTHQEQEKGIKNLQAEWGEAFDNNLIKAKAALKEFGSEEDIKTIRDMGLGNNPSFIKLMAKVGETLSEDKLVVTGQVDPKYTPAQADSEIKKILADTSSPYWNKEHAQHKEVVEHMERLFKAKG